MSNRDDPRTLLAAERTLLSWARTSLALIGLGFFIERLGIALLGATGETAAVANHLWSFLLGEAFVLTGSYLAFHAVIQHRQVLMDWGPTRVPEAHRLSLGMLASVLVGFLGILVAHYLLHLFRG